MKNKNILICGHRCTSLCIASYFIKSDNLLDAKKYVAKNGELKVYDFYKIDKIFDDELQL